MRLIDADELKKYAIPCEIHNGALTDLCIPLYQIDNVPTITGIINANDFKKRINNMEYIYIQDCAEDVIDAIDCEVTYFKEKQNNGKK